MKATGIVRRVDSLNRFVIPRELCNTLHIGPGDPMEIFVDGEKIVLRKYDTVGDLNRLLAGTENGIRQADHLPPEVWTALLDKVSEMRDILKQYRL